MNYTPTNWKTGDVITEEKLNNIEQGIVAASSVCPDTPSEMGSYALKCTVLDGVATVRWEMQLSAYIENDTLHSFSTLEGDTLKVQPASLSGDTIVFR